MFEHDGSYKKDIIGPYHKRWSSKSKAWTQQIKNIKYTNNFSLWFMFFVKLTKDWNFILLLSSLQVCIYRTKCKKLDI